MSNAILQPPACQQRTKVHIRWPTLTSSLSAAAEEAKLGPKSAATSVVIVPKKQSRWERRREEIYEKLKQNPVFQRIYGFGSYAKPVLQKGQDIVEDVQEKWETSPSPTVERIRVRSCKSQMVEMFRACNCGHVLNSAWRRGCGGWAGEVGDQPQPKSGVDTSTH
jgi:hypothetical protein